MLPLRQLQLDFSQAIFGELSAGLASAVLAGGLAAEQRLDIYRNNVFTNLRETLRVAYPVVECLVGEAFFNYAADWFISHQPSASGDIEDYGREFAEFLSRFPAAQGLAIYMMSRGSNGPVIRSFMPRTMRRCRWKSWPMCRSGGSGSCVAKFTRPARCWPPATRCNASGKSISRGSKANKALTCSWAENG